MTRLITLAYGVAVYILFFATFLYLIGFVGNAPFLPRTVDYGVRFTNSAVVSLLVNLTLIALFAVQHTVMARRGFKARWTRIIPPAAERSTYVLVTSLVLILIFWLWQPMPDMLWSVETGFVAYLLWGLFFLGWGLVLLSTFLINHFDLFGLRQVWLNFRQEPETPIPFKTSGLYRRVRHPIYLGFLLAFWAIPEMSVGHALFSLAMTVYILVGVAYEEKDLIHHFGETYHDYRRRVPMLIPFWPTRGGRDNGGS